MIHGFHRKVFTQSLLLCLVILSVGWLPALSEEAKEFSATVVGVSDGDTITVLHDGRTEKIRLASIDCPEKKQAFGMQSKGYTSSLCFGKNVRVIVRGNDRYKRSIADIHLPDGTVLNERLLKSGFAWCYTKYTSDQSLQSLEERARSDRLGLWSDTNPQAPWDFRKSKHSNDPSQMHADAAARSN